MLKEFRLSLADPPAVASDERFLIRALHYPAEMEEWLALRRAAFAEVSPGVRDWTLDDFRRQMVDKRWWRAECTLVATLRETVSPFLGAVTLAERGVQETALPIVHWLMVHPDWRRHGIAAGLVTRLARQASEAGRHAIGAETHANWLEALRFYQALGFRPTARSAVDP